MARYQTKLQSLKDNRYYIISSGSRRKCNMYQYTPSIFLSEDRVFPIGYIYILSFSNILILTKKFSIFHKLI